jgi:DNA-binding NtrC family response regulator
VLQSSIAESGEITRIMREKLPTPTVLVVDDEPLIRWSLSEGLTEAGYAVRLAANGAEARAVLAGAAGTPMVLLLDLRLPDVADLSLLGEVRTRWPKVRVVMMTAHGSAEDAARARELGVLRFVDKPFDVGEMVEIVDEAWRSCE